MGPTRVQFFIPDCIVYSFGELIGAFASKCNKIESRMVDFARITTAHCQSAENAIGYDQVQTQGTS